MKKVGICARFGNGKVTAIYNGQVVKTRSIARALEKTLGEEEVETVDTYCKVFDVPRILIEVFNLFRKCDSIIMLPAYRGIRILVPIFVFYNLFFHRKLIYLVVGGWLDEYLKEHSHFLTTFLKKYDRIFVETKAMKAALERSGFRNVSFLPYVKEITIADEIAIPNHSDGKYKLCTFSRVSYDKGIEDAVNSVIEVNKDQSCSVVILDIYGEIDGKYKKQFEELMRSAPEYIRYKGVIKPTESVRIIRNYDALVFPTFYPGEGFPATVLDAMASGVPIIASDWRYNSELVVKGKTGELFEPHKVDELVNVISDLIGNPGKWNAMRGFSIDEAKKYKPDRMLQELLEMVK